MALPRGVGFAGVFCVVEHQHVAGGRLGSNNTGILGHVAGPVYLALVVNFNLYFYFAAH